MPDIRVSVIIPVYNAAAYVAQAASSVLAQTFGDFELLLVDDGSEDGSAAVCEEIAAADARVRVLRHGENRGVAAARNTGAAAARGAWIAFLDADDSWLPEKLACQMDVIAAAEAPSCPAAGRGAAPVHLCCTGATFFEGGAGSAGDIRSFSVHIPTRISNAALRRGNVIISSSVLARRDDLLEFPMERSDLHEDFITWLRITEKYGDALGLDRPLVRRRLRKGSKSGAKLNSARMTWRTYRFMGYGFFARLWYFAHYAWHGMRRYG
ncbi:MAG: glycosyltransferase family 2 protein [Clostridiales bacterium]|nr:glycosyltransferase family 2 protein [Clostridiales bacterium]